MIIHTSIPGGKKLEAAITTGPVFLANFLR